MIEEMTPLQIVPAGPKELASGTAVLRRFADQELTLTDAVGLWLMKQKKLAVCWSTDFHLGLTAVPLVTQQE
jgi:hypothetical protein